MQQDPLIGTFLGKYKILAPLGQGGMARVYRANQENLDREVAVKVLPPWYATDRNFVERFNLEARLIARLSHPNIVTIHDFSEQEGHLYIVMQLVDGGTLKHLLDSLRNPSSISNHNEQDDSGTISIVQANQIFQQLASALTYAHEKGIIHRDIKPVNVLMDHTNRPILSDFGIAKVLESSNGLTRPGAGVGTPEYMSPEQCKGESVDRRADIYALGIMLYETLTGRTPFIGDNYHAIAHSHIYKEPPDPRLFNPHIPLSVRDVILTALQKNPEYRYQYASDFAKALGLALQVAEREGTYSGSTHRPASIVHAPTSPLYLCPHCESPNKPDVYFCTRCGSLLNPCPNCHNKNKVRDRFCIKCGYILKASSQSQ
jgi:serine/threonine protein kinase